MTSSQLNLNDDCSKLAKIIGLTVLVAALSLSIKPARTVAGVDNQKLTGPVKNNLAALGISLSAEAAIVVDADTQKVLFEKNSDQPRPLASLTKLLTALVVLNKNQKLDTAVAISPGDVRSGDVGIAIKPGEVYDLRDLLGVSLIASSNTATAALARVALLDDVDVAGSLNAMAKKIGLTQAKFYEPTGLDPRNVASAQDVAILLKTALTNPIIANLVLKSSFELKSSAGVTQNIKSTDELFGSFIDSAPYTFLGGKTGFLDESGYCFAAAAKKSGRGTIITVVLGAPTKSDRFTDVKNLIYWVFDNYTWK